MTEKVDVVVPYSPKHTPPDLLERAKQTVTEQTVETNTIVVENQVSAAFGRNKGLSRSSNRFAAFLDADDYWSNNKLEKQILRLQQEKTGICITNVTTDNNLITPCRKTDLKFVRDLLLGEIRSLTSSTLVDTTKTIPQYNEDIYRYEDYLFILEAMYNTGLSCIDENLTHVEKHSKGLSNVQEPVKHALAKVTLLHKAVELYPQIENYIDINKIVAKKYRAAGRKSHHQHEWKTAAQLYSRSLNSKVTWKTLVAILLLIARKPSSLLDFI
jgi:glycosyltransferase involved in cell wall biosynthesis